MTGTECPAPEPRPDGRRHRVPGPPELVNGFRIVIQIPRRPKDTESRYSVCCTACGRYSEALKYTLRSGRKRCICGAVPAVPPPPKCNYMGRFYLTKAERAALYRHAEAKGRSVSFIVRGMLAAAGLLE